MNRSCRPHAAAQSWLTSTSTDSIVIFFCVSVHTSPQEASIRHRTARFFIQKSPGACREPGRRLRLPYERAKRRRQGAKDMKYILLMSGSMAGVDGYRAWPRNDIDAHMAVLKSLNRELTESGEFIATQ